MYFRGRRVHAGNEFDPLESYDPTPNEIAFRVALPLPMSYAEVSEYACAVGTSTKLTCDHLEEWLSREIYGPRHLPTVFQARQWSAWPDPFL